MNEMPTDIDLANHPASGHPEYPDPALINRDGHNGWYTNSEGALAVGGTLGPPPHPADFDIWRAARLRHIGVLRD